MHILEEAGKREKNRRVDAFVQSTDKNLMVPVGGSIIGKFEHFVEKRESYSSLEKYFVEGISSEIILVKKSCIESTQCRVGKRKIYSRLKNIS